jgi:hypothetical protein
MLDHERAASIQSQLAEEEISDAALGNEFICLCLCILMYGCVYICMHVCIYIYMLKW